MSRIINRFSAWRKRRVSAVSELVSADVKRDETHREVRRTTEFLFSFLHFFSLIFSTLSARVFFPLYSLQIVPLPRILEEKCINAIR